MASSLPVPAAERTVRLLELLLQNPDGVTPIDCMTHLNLSRSSLFALLRTLKSLGYVDQTRSRGRYLPGPRLQAWQNASPSGPQELLSAFYQIATFSPINETLALAILNRAEILILAQVEPDHRLRSVFDVGNRLPLAESAASDVLIQPPAEEIRTLGYQLQKFDDTIELALPICIDGYNASAALVITAPRTRRTTDNLLTHLPELREMVAHISYRLGAQVYAPFQLPSQPAIEPTIPLTESDIHDFLSGPWASRLACIRPNGNPHVVPVWHEWDGQNFYITAWEGSKWADYILENPRVSLTVDEPWLPLRRVSAQGTAYRIKSSDLPGGLSNLLNRLGQRYLGQARHPTQSNKNLQVFKIIPDTIRGWRGIQTVNHED